MQEETHRGAQQHGGVPLHSPTARHEGLHSWSSSSRAHLLQHPVQVEPAIPVTKDLEVQVEEKRDVGAFPVVKETSRTTQDGDLDGDCQQNPE